MTESGTPTFVGTSLRRVEGREKLTGRAVYVADVDRSQMVFARLVVSPHPKARITGIVKEHAQSVPGVIGVYTAEDFAPSGDGQGRPSPRQDLLARHQVHYAGEPVAVVVAETEAAAEDGADRVEVSYERLPAVIDPVLAMLEDSPPTRDDHAHQMREDAGVHGAATGGDVMAAERPKNVTNEVRFRRGDVTRAFAEADAVVEAIYTAPAVHQGYLETHGSVAEERADGGATVWTTTQGAFGTRDETAGLLGLPASSVNLIPTVVGGGFGGKGLLHEPIVTALAFMVGRPVRLILDRFQDFQMSNPGPLARMKVKMAAAKDGLLTALEASLIFDSGALPGAPAGIAAELLGGTYRCPNLDIVSYEVITNKTPVGAYRAPGSPQAYFALESSMDELARKLGFDPIAFRLKNAVKEGDLRASGREWPRIGLIQTLEAVKDHPLLRAELGEDEGIGVAVGGWMGGTEPAAAACRLNGDGSISIQIGSVDITGTNTAFQAIAADGFGIDPARVRVVPGDTEHSPYAGFAGGSKTAYTVGAAVLEAARDARAQVLQVAADRLETSTEDLEIAGDSVVVRGAPQKRITLREIADLTMSFGQRYAPIQGNGRSAVHRASPGFAVHIARVKVDRETGAVRVQAYVAAQDVGRALNPAEVTGQVRGGVAQGIGRALFEDLAYGTSGELQNASLADYLLPTFGDVPSIETILVEVPSEHGPYGAKGVGEPPAVPGLAAIGNALRDALGVRLTEAPFTPDRVLRAIGTLEGKM